MIAVQPRARIALVFVGIYVLLTAAAYLAGETYLAACLPLLRTMSEWSLPPASPRRRCSS